MKRWEGHVARMGRGEGIPYFCGEIWGKEDTWETQDKWEDNIKMDFQELGSGCIEWIGLAQNRDRSCAFVNAVMNFRLYNLWGFS